MKEIFNNLYCGNDNDWTNLEKEHIPGRNVDQPTNGWAVLHACKESHHRIFVGYTSRGCPKDSSEYLWAERENRLALNIVDAPKPEFFDKKMIEKALVFIEQKLTEGFKYFAIVMSVRAGQHLFAYSTLSSMASSRVKL